MRTTRSRPSSGASTGLVLAIVAIFAIVAGVIVVGTMRQRDRDAARTAAERRASAAAVPPVVPENATFDDDDDFDDEVDVAAAPPIASYDERARDDDVPFDPSSKAVSIEQKMARRLNGGDARPAADDGAASSPVAPPPTSTAGKPRSDRLFSMVLDGRIAGVRIDPDDAQTWARVCYFLQQEAASPRFLLYPTGKVPIAKRSDAGGRVTGAPLDVKRPNARYVDPGWRLTLTVTAAVSGGVEFYGEQLGRSFDANIACSIERYENEDEGFTTVKRFRIRDGVTRSDGSESDAKLVRAVYEAALEKLAERLAALEPFTE